MDKQRIAAFADRLFGDIAASTATGLAYIGVKKGLFHAMAGKGALRLEQVVGNSGLQARYVEEWAKAMFAAGYLDYDPAAETYTLPEEHAYLLASEGMDHFLGGLFYQSVGCLGVAPRVAKAFEHGGGVPFAAYGDEMLVGLNLANQGIYEHRFARYWLKALPETEEKLRGGGKALDVGCGTGRVSLTLANAFPDARFMGVDLDEQSIRRVRADAEGEQLQERVQFEAKPVQGLDPQERFDLITVCDTMHDFAEPVETLAAIRDRLAPDGVLFVVEPKVADRLEDNRNPIAAMFYGFSVLH